MFEPPEIDASGAHRFLTEHLGRDVGPVELVGAGAWSRCFGFRDGDQDLVIRFGKYVHDFEKDARAASFSSPALPVPAVSEIGATAEGYFAISARAYGKPLESTDAAEWAVLLPALFAVLDALRDISVADTTGFGTWAAPGRGWCTTWRDFLLSVAADTPHHRTYGWRQRLIDSPVGDTTFRAGLTRLSELADASPNERYVVHADLINRNVLVEADRITAVFDWGCSLYGDFLYDLAWIEFWEPWYPAIAASNLRMVARDHYASTGLEVEDLDERMRCCMIHIGLDHLAYSAYTGVLDDLVRIDARTQSLLD